MRREVGEMRKQDRCDSFRDRRDCRREREKRLERQRKDIEEWWDW